MDEVTSAVDAHIAREEYVDQVQLPVLHKGETSDSVVFRL